MRTPPTILVACFFLAVGLSVSAQPARSARGEWFVPWKVLNPGIEPPRALLVLYWIPGSRDDLRHSELMTSRELAEAAGDCVSLQIIRPEDGERLASLRGSSTVPFAVLVEGGGQELARVGNVAGILPPGAIAALILDELAARAKRADRLLGDARKRQGDGDRAGAMQLCQLVEAGGCTIPRQSKSAAKMLRKLRGR